MQTIYKNQPSFNLILDVPPVKQGIRQFWTLTENHMEISNCLVTIAEKFDNDLHSLRAAIEFLTAENSTVEELQGYLMEHKNEKDFYKHQLQYLFRLSENEKELLRVLGQYKRIYGLDLTKKDVQDWISGIDERRIMDHFQSR